MKETTFLFRFRRKGASDLSPVQRIKDTAGVVEATEREVSRSIELKVRISFDNASQAKRIHNRVLKRLIDCKEITLESAETVVSEILD